MSEIYNSDYGRMMRGEKPVGCTCEMTRPMMNGYSGPEPAEWILDILCPLHGGLLTDEQLDEIRDDMDWGQPGAEMIYKLLDHAEACRIRELEREGRTG